MHAECRNCVYEDYRGRREHGCIYPCENCAHEKDDEPMDEAEEEPEEEDEEEDD